MEKLLSSQIIYNNLLKNLPTRVRDVIKRRFGLEKATRETLESIGRSYGVCRERIRQIEQSGIALIKKEIKKPIYQRIFRYFNSYLKKEGGLKREDLLLSQFSSSKVQNRALFWLTLGESFFRFPETEDLYPLWTVNPKSVDLARQVINGFVEKFKKEKKLISEKEALMLFKNELKVSERVTSRALISYLEISKDIEKNYEGLFGLKHWPEVSPRGIKDKAYLALKKSGRPLHFAEVAKLISQLNIGTSNKPVLPQTVHNELIRDPRFVLVGRGIYALREWGYVPGQVRDIIIKVLREENRPLSREEIIEKVLSQRLVKENTILLNLQNKDYFLRDSQGRYILKEI
ncbi:hypothetical protein J7K03_01190 [bacterium]|nr:hypothetical protein [bacterium]